MIPIRRLVWDDWNTDHIARHAVVPDEVEEVCRGDFIVREGHSERIMLIGRTKAGRLLSVILGVEGAGIYYPVTARPASRRERRQYRSEREDVTL